MSIEVDISFLEHKLIQCSYLISRENSISEKLAVTSSGVSNTTNLLHAEYSVQRTDIF